MRVLRVCTDSVLEVLPSETNTRSLRSLGWHDPSLDNITMLDDGDVLYWRHYAARGTASKVAIAFGVGARWAKTLRAGNDLAAGKTMADAHAWNQVEVRAAEAPSTAGPASWEGMAVEVSLDASRIAALARESDTALASLSRVGKSSIRSPWWSERGGRCSSGEWAPRGSALRSAGLLLRSVPSRLKALSIVCDETENGWWTTKVCPGDRVSQYHKHSDGQEADDEPPHTSLGEFAFGSDMLVVPQHGRGSGSAQGTAAPGASTEPPYLIQQFVDGAPCNGETPWLRRTTELRVRCMPGIKLKLLAVTEPRTCHYEVMAGSALACGHPLLHVDSLARPPLEQVVAAGPTVTVQCAPMNSHGGARDA